MVRDTRYFGRNRPEGGAVRETEWRRFLSEIITLRFPDGLTVVKATGQWRNTNGYFEREGSEVVTVHHTGDHTARGKFAEIVDGTVRLAKVRDLWQGLGNEHDVQPIPRLPLSG